MKSAWECALELGIPSIVEMEREVVAQEKKEDEASMTEIPRMSISKFKATAKAGMDLPVIVTSDDEDAFAVVPMAMTGIFPSAPPPFAMPKWFPPDLAIDS